MHRDGWLSRSIYPAVTHFLAIIISFSGSGEIPVFSGACQSNAAPRDLEKKAMNVKRRNSGIKDPNEDRAMIEKAPEMQCNPIENGLGNRERVIENQGY